MQKMLDKVLAWCSSLPFSPQITGAGILCVGIIIGCVLSRKLRKLRFLFPVFLSMIICFFGFLIFTADGFPEEHPKLAAFSETIREVLCRLAETASSPQSHQYG